MNSPAYLTRTETAEWLRCSVDTVDRMLVEGPKPPAEGKIRYVLANINGRARVRILKADVLAILPEAAASLQ